MSSYRELIAQKEVLDKQAADLASQIQDAKQVEHRDAIAKITALMAEHGVSLQDLGASSGKRKASTRTSPIRGTKIDPKYKDPATGATWTGRGLKPKWLSAAIAAGRTIDEFRI